MPNWKKVVVSGSSAHLNQITGSGGVKLADDVVLNIGDGNDLQLYHDGSHSYIKDNGTGNLYYRGGTQTFQNGAGSKTMVVLNSANSVDLNYNNSTKFQTTNTGISVTGNVVPSGNISGSSTSTGSFGAVSIDGSPLIKGSSKGLVFDGDTIYAEGGWEKSYEFHSGANNNVALFLVTNAGANKFEIAMNNTNAQFSNRDNGRMDFHTNGHNFMTAGEDGQVGFGTQTPTVAVQIEGKTLINNDLEVTGSISGSASSTGSFGHLIIDKDAYIGEDLLADGDVVAYNSSDVRLKDNIQVIKGSLDKIDGIRGVEFDWNDKSPGWAQERGHDIGVIAQEVQKVVPEIVVERKNGYLGVDYKRLVPLLIESVKKLRQEVEDLKKKVN